MGQHSMGSQSVYVNLYAYKQLKDAGINVSQQINRFIETLAMAEGKDPYLAELQSLSETERDLRSRARVMQTQSERMLSHANTIRDRVEELRQERIVLLAAQKRRELIWHMNIIIKNAEYKAGLAWALTKDVRAKLGEHGRELDYADFSTHVQRLLSVAD